MWTNFYRIALIRANVKARISRQNTLRYIQRLVITQHGASEAAALHLRQLVNQHVAGGHDLAFEAQAATEQKRLAESASISEFGEVELNAFNIRQRNVAWIVRICNF